MLPDNYNENTTPVASVIVTTYNHAHYIEQAVLSAINQQTDFRYEILIGDDCSTDGTDEIVRRLATEHPDKIRVLLRPHNLGLNGKNNIADLFRKARGRYLAALEGDDYWTDPRKLSKQVQFLENNTDYTMTFHWTQWLDQASGKIANNLYGPHHELKSFYTLDDLLEFNNFIPTCSVVCRNNIATSLPDFFFESDTPDWLFHVLNALHGKINFFDQTMAVYRRHAGGIYGGENPLTNAQRLLHTYHLIAKHLNLDRCPSYHKGLSACRTVLLATAMQAEKLNPPISANDEILLAYTKNRLSLIGKQYPNIALFPGGKHTKKILKLMRIWHTTEPNIILPEITAIIDENPSCKSIDGIKVFKPNEFDNSTANAIIISSDTSEHEFTSRWISLNMNNLPFINLYEGIPTPNSQCMNYQKI